MAKKQTNAEGEVTGWVGWIGFAVLMLFITGIFHMITGLVALFTDTVYFLAEENIWVLDYTTWGWAHIIAGLLAVLAASSLSQGHLYGKTFAVLVALASLVANMMFIPIYPVWSLLIIVIDILVIYAVTVHGNEVKE